MKIVYTILGTFNSGGMERVLANKANYLIGCGYEVSIYTTDQQGRKSYFELNPKIKTLDLGINYTENSKSNFVKKVFSYKQKQRRHHQLLKQELLKHRPDIVITMFDHDATFLHKINDGSKKIAEIHFSRFKRLQYGRTGVWKILDNYRNKNDISIARKYDRFVVLTEEDKGYWGNDLHNIRVIPNANSFIPDSQALLDNKKVLAVGRFDYQKGFEDLIKAWKVVHSEHEDWQLNIFGQGPLEDEFEKLIDQLKLTDTVSLRKPTRQIEQVYLDHSILAMTSRYEGLPMVLLEAQSCGLPLVSYMCKCGPKDIIDENKNGYLIAEGDIEGMADGISKLISNEKLRKEMGANAYQMSKRFDEEVVMGLWTKLFNEVSQA